MSKIFVMFVIGAYEIECGGQLGTVSVVPHCHFVLVAGCE
jgi:hypothetical protein